MSKNAEISRVGSYLANYNFVIIKDGKLIKSIPYMNGVKFPFINAAFTQYTFGKGQQIDPVNIGDIQKWVNWHTVIGTIRYYKTSHGYKVEAYHIDSGYCDFTILHFDEQGQLHNEKGPAVAILDMGGELYIHAVHGEYAPKMFNGCGGHYVGRVSLKPNNDNLVKTSKFISIREVKDYQGPAYCSTSTILTVDGVIYSDPV